MLPESIVVWNHVDERQRRSHDLWSTKIRDVRFRSSHNTLVGMWLWRAVLSFEHDRPVFGIQCALRFVSQ